MKQKIVQIYESTNVDWRDIWWYGCSVLLTHVIMRIFYYVVMAIINDDNAYGNGKIYSFLLQNRWAYYLLTSLLLYTIIIHLISFRTVAFFASYECFICDQKYMWLKSGLLLMLPCEMFRLLFSFVPIQHIQFGNHSFGSAFAPIANQMWKAVREIYSIQADGFLCDCLLYLPCHLLYVVAFLGIQLYIYRHYWKKECAELIRKEKEASAYREAQSKYGR